MPVWRDFPAVIRSTPGGALSAIDVASGTSLRPPSLVHLYTASGFVLAFLATIAVIEGDYRLAFLYLWLQVAVDATDGWLARRARVTARVPEFSGKTLDDLVDFLTYVFVPALAVLWGGIVLGGWATTVGSAMLLSSGFGFSRVKAKTSDHFFTGFPSYWNIVVLYLFVL